MPWPNHDWLHAQKWLTALPNSPKPWLHAQKIPKNNINPKPWFLKAMILAKIPVPPFHLDPPGLHNTLVPSSCWYKSSYLQVAVWPRCESKGLVSTPHEFLVGGWPTPLKNMTSSVGMMKFPICRKIIKFMFQTHQPDFFGGSGNDVPGGGDRKIWVPLATVCHPDTTFRRKTEASKWWIHVGFTSQQPTMTPAGDVEPPMTIPWPSWG